ncbi:MAG: Holliday junction resolvase RuvX [Ferrimicrobium sp.]
MARIVGVDLGLARIGVAVSAGSIAVGVGTIDRNAHWISTLTRIVQDYGVDTIVVGLPLGMSGEETEMTGIIRSLASEIETAFGLRVVFMDERLTSAASRRALREAGVPGRSQKGLVDELAAVAILQSFLDRKSVS